MKQQKQMVPPPRPISPENLQLLDQFIGYCAPDITGKRGNRLIKIDPSETTQYVLLDGDFEIEQVGNTITIKAIGPSFYDRCMKGKWK